ncbi:hypothetical protein EP51_43030 (plasmid) [Rhodococcus opacus]|uniref:AMP-binding enzyme C-terminal domain-containing protein n=1 Tax=Rhodococcus opacus TaxID=37919 RepID=A0A076F0F7_RHOOP|nr:hypothetical protein EP51_43030 [Rhodococcus opacus]
MRIHFVEVESGLAAHPQTLMAAVYGVADPEWRVPVKAVVVRGTRMRTVRRELIGYLHERLAHYKCPRIVESDELPKSGSRKNLRILRDLDAKST